MIVCEKFGIRARNLHIVKRLNDRYQQPRAKADLPDISQDFDTDDMFTFWPAISEIISEITKFVPPEKKLFDNKKVTVLSIKTWKHQNASSKNRASRPEAVWSR